MQVNGSSYRAGLSRLFLLLATGLALGSITAGGARNAQAQVSEPAMRVFIDPKTGERRAPTPSELKQLRQARPQVGAASQTPAFRGERLPNGMVKLYVSPDFYPQLQVRKTTDDALEARHSRESANE